MERKMGSVGNPAVLEELPMIDELGFVGLGSMGSRMVRRFLQAGLKVRVFDVSSTALEAAVAQGACVASSPAQLASEVATVLVSLPTPDVVREVAIGRGGLIEGDKIKRYVDLSTTGIVVAQQVSEALAARGVATLDAPVSGGPPGAQAGTLAIMAAGDRALFDDLKEVLAVLGNRITLVGDNVGQGQITKLINNLLVSTNYAAACEAVVFGVKAGLDARTLVDIINESSGKSFSSETLLSKHGITRTFDYGFRLELMNKDIRLALQAAEKTGATMFTINSAAQLWSHANASLDPAADYTTLLQVLESWGGVVAGKPEPSDKPK
jgi:3-hydroxyisobutyrate dehydrogenase-like beta-hydroxyacid dehydrogenase